MQFPTYIPKVTMVERLKQVDSTPLSWVQILEWTKIFSSDIYAIFFLYTYDYI